MPAPPSLNQPQEIQGLALHWVAAVKGYKVILTMPESMSIERRRILTAFGARLELTPKEKGMKGAIARAEELKGSIENSWIPSQFDNDANVVCPIEKILQRKFLLIFRKGIDYIITGVGTGGHISGGHRNPEKEIPETTGICRRA